MGSPIFDATFGTGRFKSEEPMTTDRLSSSAGVDVRKALNEALRFLDFIEHEESAQYATLAARKICDVLEKLPAQPNNALKTRFEEWAFTRGHRNFTKSGGGYLLPEIQKDWLAFKAGATALPSDCPTEGVAARQGNGG